MHKRHHHGYYFILFRDRNSGNIMGHQLHFRFENLSRNINYHNHCVVTIKNYKGCLYLIINRKYLINAFLLFSQLPWPTICDMEI